MATAKDRAAREQRERTRQYEARATLHREQERRRRRDNVLGLTIGGLVVAAAVAGQALFYSVGPGAAADDGELTPAPIEQPTDAPSE